MMMIMLFPTYIWLARLDQQLLPEGQSTVVRIINVSWKVEVEVNYLQKKKWLNSFIHIFSEIGNYP